MPHSDQSAADAARARAKLYRGYHVGVDIGSTCSTSAIIWTNWNQLASSTTTGTCTYTVANSVIWPTWASNTVSLYTPAAAETDAQRTARIEREAQRAREWQAQERVRLAERAAADLRAEALLHAHLDREQQQQLAERDWFLHVSASGKRYRINRGRSANIDVLDEQGKVVRSLCAHPRLDVPDADTMLAQALMLKHEEDEFLRMANVHPIGHGFRRRPLAPEERAA